MSQATKLVIVESPTKARTIRKYLGSDYRVEASMGHIRDLPASANEIPAHIKKEPWARIGVDIDNGYKPIYVVPTGKKKLVTELRRAVKEAEVLYVATDEDREGESIGWHLLEVLKPKIPVYRMVFHEITREAIHKALASPRELDTNLVQAQETRRVLDRLVGYTISPFLWKKIKPRLSAGRVQSVAVRILVLKERKRMAFVSGSYWDLSAKLLLNQLFNAKLVRLNGKRIANGRDFNEQTGEIDPKKNVLLLDKKTAQSLKIALTDQAFKVVKIERKEKNRLPKPPFTTSTLQQEANRKLGYDTRRTMQIAQQLYEQGLITYMRTDSVNLSKQAISAARQKVRELYGEENLASKPRQYKNKSKNAQEAHEAIRPAGSQMPLPKSLVTTTEARRLYELIWKRTIATQMKPAKLAFTNVTLETTDSEGQIAHFKAAGKEVLFYGYFRAYVEGSDDPNALLEDQSDPLPQMMEGSDVQCRSVEAFGHATKPPARYTEATLVKELEEQGVGRPSTYASIIDTIQRRGYVQKNAKQLVPTFIGMAVTALLEKTLKNVVDVAFTAELEQKLDEIAEGSDGLAFLDNFYRQVVLKGIEDGKEIDAKEVCTLRAARYGTHLIRVGRYGAYVESTQEDGSLIRVTIPTKITPGELDKKTIEKIIERKKLGNQPLGKNPENNLNVYVLDGRFGPYLQLGELDKDSDKKPKRVSLPPVYSPEKVTLVQALALLALPRMIGLHLETQKPIEASIGRYGPYVKHEKKYASLQKSDDVLFVELDRALILLQNKRSSDRSPLRTLGEHPDGGEIKVFEGRWGPYVKHKRLNASLPKDLSIEEVTLQDAIALLAIRAAKPKKTRRTNKKVAKKTTTKRKTAAKKPATKRKTAAKKPATKRKTAAKV